MNKPTDSAELRRVVLASFIGTTIEWYDFFLYGTAAALVFNRLFFPTLDPLAGTLSAYATYAVGFVARPLGGAIFGHFGDRAGRKKMLVWSLSLMGVSSTLIGLTPTYDRIGIWAPIMASSCSTTTTVLPRCFRFTIAPLSRSTSRGCSPTEGSSSTYSMSKAGF